MISSKSTRLNHLISLSNSTTRTHGCNSPKFHIFINRKYLHQNHPNTLITKTLYPEEMHGGKPATWSTLRDGHKGSKNWPSRIPLDADRDDKNQHFQRNQECRFFIFGALLVLQRWLDDCKTTLFLSLGAEKSFVQWRKDDLTVPPAEPTSWVSMVEGKIREERGESREVAMAVSLSADRTLCF